MWRPEALARSRLVSCRSRLSKGSDQTWFRVAPGYGVTKWVAGNPLPPNAYTIDGLAKHIHGHSSGCWPDHGCRVADWIEGRPQNNYVMLPDIPPFRQRNGRLLVPTLSTVLPNFLVQYVAGDTLPPTTYTIGAGQITGCRATNCTSHQTAAYSLCTWVLVYRASAEDRSSLHHPCRTWVRYGTDGRWQPTALWGLQRGCTCQISW
jgi:hypothetical protein